MRVLLVEDDRMIGESLDQALTAAGMAVDWVGRGLDCLDALKGNGYGLVLLDLGLPDGNGLEILRQLRQRGDFVPVIIITARDQLDARVTGLDSGADDYLIKPFDFDELHARIRAVVRRHQGQAESQMTVGDVTLNLASHTAVYRDVAHVLPAKEFALLQALAERPGSILSRQQLEDRLYDWGNEVESNAVDVLIHYVRRRFGKEVVQNVRGVGWMIPERQI
jgi:DNA-binding response OmpR family regulator